MEKEKEKKQIKKLEEKELIQILLKKMRLIELKNWGIKKKEKINDINAIKEYTKILERQEQERVEYFKRIERNSNNYMNKMAETVLENLDKKSKEEEDKMRGYLEEKEKK
jgi:hypothetical protein